MDLNREVLTELEKRELRDFEQLFESPGWTIFQRMMQARYDATLNQIESAEDMKALGSAQGRREAFREVVEFEKAVESGFIELSLDKVVEREELELSRGAMA